VRSPTSGPLLTKIDPHVHGGASACARMADEELLAWFDQHPEYAVVVSDHMAWDFYRRPELLSCVARSLYSVELTVADRFDFLLLATDLSVFDRLRSDTVIDSPRLSRPPMDLFGDPRVLVTFAHPPVFDTRAFAALPDWLLELPVDLLEYNMARLSVHPRLGATTTSSGVPAALEDASDRLRKLRAEVFPRSRFVVGSDAHDSWSLGRTYLELTTACVDAAAVWEGVRRGDYVGHLEIRGVTFSVDPWEGLTP
jgi:hypothetical protein